MRTFLLEMLLLSLLLTPGLAEDRPTARMKRALNRLQSLNSPAASKDCAEEMTAFPDVGKLLGSPQPDQPRFWATRGCDELFQTSAPAWLQLAASNDSSVSLENWWPVCSLTNLDTVRRNHRDVHQMKELVSRLDQYTLGMDLCRQGEKAMRGGDGYISPSQKKHDLSPMSESQRKAHEKVIASLKDEVAAFCCKGGRDCLEQFQKVSITWCKPQEDPNVPDPCVEDGNQFDPMIDWNTEEGKKLLKFLVERYDWKTLQPREFPLPSLPGKIILSPFLEKTGVPSADPGMIAHELGHACSHIQSLLAISQGSKDEYYHYRASFNWVNQKGESIRDCKVYLPNIATYRKMLEGLGEPPAVSNCLIDLAADGTDKTRFDDRACPKACSTAALEEAFAAWMQTRVLPGSTFLKYCTAMKDSTHPMVQDVMSCMIRNPENLSRFKKVVGCQQE